MKEGIHSKRLSSREIVNRMTRLELQQAEDIGMAVRRFLFGHTPEEVAERIGMPKTLVRKLKSDDPGNLWDCVLWMRRKRKMEEKQCLET